MSIRLSVFLVCLFPFTAQATVHEVGPDAAYLSPNALYLAEVVRAGDTINISGGPYTGRDALAVWQADDLLIRGIGEQPVLFAGGEFIWGKGIWVCAGDRITVENIAFHDASVPDKNGAGIRLDGVGLTVRHCLFRNNENGILTSNPGTGDILIEYSEFDGGGFGDGFSHNLYIGRVRSLVFRFNYSHHTKVGHCLKSRAQANRIEYNRIMDEESGNSSRLIDLPNGGLSTVRGNLFMQGPGALNNNMLGYGHEGYADGITHELYIGNNTFVNQRTGSCLFVDIRPGADVAWLVNNYIVGTGTLLQGEVAGQGGNIRAGLTEAGFVDPDAYDYRLLPSAPAVDAGVTTIPGSGVVFIPDSVYLDFLMAGARTRFGGVDAGAYEYEWPTSTTVSVESDIVLFPNPTTGPLRIQSGSARIIAVWVIDAKGGVVRNFTDVDQLDLTGLPPGVYSVFLRFVGGASVCRRIVKL